MNKIFLFLLVLTFSSGFLNAQEGMGRHDHNGPGEKMKDLEKVKLIEALDMDEETTLKFFARRNAHMEKMEGLRKKEDEQLDRIDDLVKSSGDQNDPQLKKMIEDYFKITNEIIEARKTFLNSLSDILTTKQIGKLVVFEQKFRREVGKILFEKRKFRPEPED